MSKLRTIVVVGHLIGTVGREKCAYLERLDAQLRREGYRLLLIEQGGRDVDTTCAVDRLPAGTAEGESPLPETLRAAWEASPALQHAVDTDAGFFSIETEQAARKYLGAAWHIREILQRERAVLCVLWHQFNGVCMALEEFCRQARVPHLFAHLGPLPGTIVFEAGGQMAESWICRENQRFLDLPVSQEDIDRASDYLDHVRQTRADRKPQTTEWSIADRAERLRERAGRLLFYAGQNDFRSGIAPRSLPNATLHSPLFASTSHGLEALAALADEHRWGILYKPHPSVREPAGSTPRIDAPCVDTVTGANIFECILESEVTVTIVSTAAYLALIHNRPAVLLGRMPLSGKGCAYEVESRADTARCIEMAMRDGFTERQQQCFLQHATQLIKYYLFAFDDTTAVRIGRDVDTAVEYLMQQCRRA